MLTFGGIAKYVCLNCKTKFFIELFAGGFVFERAKLPPKVKCPNCGSENVKPGLLSKLLY